MKSLILLAVAVYMAECGPLDNPLAGSCDDIIQPLKDDVYGIIGLRDYVDPLDNMCFKMDMLSRQSQIGILPCDATETQELEHWLGISNYTRCNETGISTLAQMKQSPCRGNTDMVTGLFRKDQFCTQRYKAESVSSLSKEQKCILYQQTLKCAAKSAKKVCGAAYEAFFSVALHLHLNELTDEQCRKKQLMTDIMLAGYGKLDSYDLKDHIKVADIGEGPFSFVLKSHANEGDAE